MMALARMPHEGSFKCARTYKKKKSVWDAAIVLLVLKQRNYLHVIMTVVTLKINGDYPPLGTTQIRSILDAPLPRYANNICNHATISFVQQYRQIYTDPAPFFRIQNILRSTSFKSCCIIRTYSGVSYIHMHTGMIYFYIIDSSLSSRPTYIANFQARQPIVATPNPPTLRILRTTRTHFFVANPLRYQPIQKMQHYNGPSNPSCKIF